MKAMDEQLYETHKKLEEVLKTWHSMPSEQRREKLVAMFRDIDADECERFMRKIEAAASQLCDEADRAQQSMNASEKNNDNS